MDPNDNEDFLYQRWLDRRIKKELDEMYAEYPNQRGGVLMKGGTPSNSVKEALRPAPGMPLQLPNGMRTPSKANVESLLKSSDRPAPVNNGEAAFPTANETYDLPK